MVTMSAKVAVALLSGRTHTPRDIFRARVRSHG